MPQFLKPKLNLYKMKNYRIEINGVQLLSEIKFESSKAMKNWTFKTLKRSGSQLRSIVTVFDNEGNDNHRFIAIPDGRKQAIRHERI
jgi:hypothetical protein